MSESFHTGAGEIGNALFGGGVLKMLIKKIRSHLGMKMCTVQSERLVHMAYNCTHAFHWPLCETRVFLFVSGYIVWYEYSSIVGLNVRFSVL